MLTFPPTGGPPGTGKTKTLCEATLQILDKQPTASVLLCAPSDTAADTLALRLGKHLRPGQLLRLNSTTRTFAEVPESLVMFCHIVEHEGSSSFGMPAWHDLMRARVVVTATHDVSMLLRARCSNIDFQRLRQFMDQGLRAHQGPSDPDLHWTHLLVDEAGQGTEAEMMAAIACVLPLASTTSEPVFCLCGDAAQLGPRITSHEARSHGLDWSLFERLLSRKIYADALKSARLNQKKQDRGNGTTQPASPILCALRRNYRACNPHLIMVPSALFYHDALLPCAPHKEELNTWHGLPNASVPMLFENVDSPDVWVDEGVSWHSESCSSSSISWF